MANRVENIYNFVIDVFQMKLKTEADNIEKYRKKIYGVYRFSKIVSSICAVIAIISFVSMYLFSYASSDGEATGLNPAYSVIILIISFLLFTILGLLATVLHNSFSYRVKRKLFPEVYKALDKDLMYIPGKIKISNNPGLEGFVNSIFNKSYNPYEFEDEIRRLDILPYYDIVSIDDVIYGKYQNHNVKIIEFSLIEKRVYYGKRGRRVEYIEVFHGVLFKTVMNKFIPTKVYIKQKGLTSKINLNHMEKIMLESSAFQKVFDVYSNDQIESRYFLNTSTMDNLLQINNSGQRISCYVSGNDINILVHTNKDMFEPDIHKAINNPNNYFEILFQAKLILDIITKLNLESKTGL